MNKRLYYSVFDAIGWITFTKDVKQDSGWGRLVITMRDLLLKAGYELVDSPIDADLEFYVGQPPFYLRPQMHPAVTLSMFETDYLPRLWVESFNRWDEIINPSTWGRNCFIQNGVTQPVHVLPLPINFEKFKYCEHNNEEWTFIAQAVQLLDRKRADIVVAEFQKSMPSDTRLIVKTIPRFAGCEFDMWLNDQIHLIQMTLPFNDYYDLLSSAHVSVNPSSGEGAGYLPGESMAVGLCTIMTDFSALQDLLANDCTIGLKNVVSSTDVFISGGNDAKVDIDDMREKMIWTYEHQDEALAMGKRSSDWIRDFCSSTKIINSLDRIFENLINTVPKTLSIRTDTDPKEHWIHVDSLPWTLREKHSK